MPGEVEVVSSCTNRVLADGANSNWLLVDLGARNTAISVWGRSGSKKCVPSSKTGLNAGRWECVRHRACLLNGTARQAPRSLPVMVVAPVVKSTVRAAPNAISTSIPTGLQKQPLRNNLYSAEKILQYVFYFLLVLQLIDKNIVY